MHTVAATCHKYKTIRTVTFEPISERSAVTMTEDAMVVDEDRRPKNINSTNSCHDSYHNSTTKGLITKFLIYELLYSASDEISQRKERAHVEP